MNHENTNKLTDHIFVLLLLTYIFLFEWIFFTFDSFQPLVHFLKISIPLCLCGLTLSSNISFGQFRPFNHYIILLALLFVWAFFPSVLSDNSTECVDQWLKFLPRCLMIFAAGAYFMMRPRAVMLLLKLIAILSFLVVTQFIIFGIAIYLHPNLMPQVFFDNGISLYGRWGLLGGYVSLPGRETFRLLSYWLEPSKASGFLFPAFFLTRALYLMTQMRKWKWVSEICLLGGFLCFSNAGYLGLAGALLYGVLRAPHIKSRQFFILLFAIALMLFAFLGRWYVTESHTQSIWLRALTGAHTSTTQINYDAISDGRVSLLESNFKTISHHLLGAGIHVPGTQKSGEHFIISGSAPIYWLVFTGLPGLLLLLLAQLQILYAAMQQPASAMQIKITQAWLAALLQQTIYGDWMSPFFLVLSLLVFVSIYQNRFAVSAAYA